MAANSVVVEISGDGGMGVWQRLRYIATNVARNVTMVGDRPSQRSFCSARLSRTPVTASPGRVLTESFLLTELPRLLAQRDIRVLEIGCGSGTLTRLLAEGGYRGEYVGVDISDRFDRAEQVAFRRQFVRTDAKGFEPDGLFDLVISVSVLEHIPDDHTLIQRLTDFVAPGGLQLHFVPSACGLFAYLWHGYRQYNIVAFGSRFDVTRATVYALGGGATLFLHVLFITLGEILLPLKLRKRIPRVYGGLLDYCLGLDRLLPRCGTMYAVIQPGPGACKEGNGFDS